MALFLATSSAAAAEPGSHAAVSKVKAYFFSWDVLTPTRLSAEDVVRGSDIVIEINDPVSAAIFVEWLRLDELAIRKSHEPGEARLTIDILYQDGSRSRYYANDFTLFSGDSTRSRPIDQEFRDRFDIARK